MEHSRCCGLIAEQQPISNLNVQEAPYAPIRFLNHWDNLNGTIERGYAGKSIFWDNDHITTDLDRVRDYARLMASVGINGCSINNVNADPRVVSAEFLPQIAKIADAFRPWGVRMMVSLDFASPRKIGGIDTFDPLDPRAVEFWKKTIDQIVRGDSRSGRMCAEGGFGGTARAIGLWPHACGCGKCDRPRA